jgi:type IV pilus assembly protein PilW
VTCLTKCPFGSKKAFTLVELLVALAMASMFMAATMTIADMSIKTYAAQERVSDAQQSLRAAMDLMIRDIRMAGYDPMAVSHGPTPGIGIIAATGTMLQISADLNADRQDNGGIENLTYFCDAQGRRLRQQEGPKPAVTLDRMRNKTYPQTFIENVSALEFSYYDGQNEPTTEIEEIVSVVVSLTVENKNNGGDTFRRTLTARINCRNLRI